MLKTPPLQTASATIETLCGRLQSATLLEDRRAAILGLRSFAKQYPASVAAGALRELIATLRRDGLGEAEDDGTGAGDVPGRKKARGGEAEGGDVDTIRLVLETLLMLFNPDSTSPEASDEIAYFMADGFSMRQAPIALLLSLLDPASPHADYYSRLYSLQLLSAICAARPERLQDCILATPLGISRLVSTLDDQRDAVRNASLLLLVDLTSGAANDDLRKLVAFEDVFGKIFALIHAEGGLAEAGITALDCLSLLANLVKRSPSNQTMFRESGCVPQLTQLLSQAFPPTGGGAEAVFVAQAREKAAWGLLQLLRLFLEPGEPGTTQNQTALFRAGTAQVLIDLAFAVAVASPIRTLALRSAAALIASNPPLQEAFAGLTIDASAPPLASEQGKLSPHTNGGTRATPGSSARTSARQSAERPRTHIIEALLDLTLTHSSAPPGLRTAGCRLIQAYLAGHERIKAHFLQRAIQGHAEHEPAANALNTLLSIEGRGGDAVGVVHASAILADLVVYTPEAKDVLGAVREGEEGEGEDVLSFVQALGAQLLSGLQSPASSSRQQLVAAYASLLAVLLWENAEGVDDLLAEGSALLQALVQAALHPTAATDPVPAGLAAVLLGTVYEFSTKDSPIPRRTLAPLLTQKLGRGAYLAALSGLRRDPAVRDHDLLGDEDAGGDAADGARLSAPLVDLVQTEYARLRRAIDKDPGVEVIPPSAAGTEGVDRDVLDELRSQLQTAREALAAAQQDALGVRQAAEQEGMAARRELQGAVGEVERLGRINRAMQAGHEGELEEMARTHEEIRRKLVDEHARAIETLQQTARAQLEAGLREQGEAAVARVREHEQRAVEVGNLLRAEQGRHADARGQLEAVTAQHLALTTREAEVRRAHEELGPRHERLGKEHAALGTRAATAEGALGEARAKSEMGEVRIVELEARLGEAGEELRAREAELRVERAGFGELERELEKAKVQLADAVTAAGVGSASPGVEAAPSTAHVARLETLETEVKVAKAAEGAAREELEGMLLLLGGLEAERNGYKAKVRALGGEVSDDEEDEEDDAEEEEDENEDEDEGKTGHGGEREEEGGGVD
ncbi:Vesicle-mediated ER to Golgi transport protein [Teratosphaeriaceae sp. CCFEE 6253]|nr:Vesicle-mediated ER to Golgi transport protein [Teratosphaeriaceae sp. CCFEE 6253]